MSAGRFSEFKYEMENGLITFVRLQPETVAANIGAAEVNSEPAGEADAGLPSAKVSLNDGEIGIRPRYVTGKWESDVPTDYDDRGIIKLSILSIASKAEFTKGKIVNYLGGTIKIGRVFPEQVI